MMMTLGERIRQERERRDISQAELARRIGVSKNTMNMIEESKIADPRFSRVLAIAQQLGMSLDALARGVAPPRPDKPRGRKIHAAVA
jgi:putative transcriptional regulator